MSARPPDMSPRQAAEMLGEIDQLRQRARRTLGAPWFPLVCFGALTMLSAPLLAVAGTAVLAPFWILAGGGGMLFTRRHYRRRIRGRGVAGHGRRAWAVGVTMYAGAFAAGIIGGTAAGEAAGVLAPMTVTLAGFALLGWLQRSPAAPLAVASGTAVAGALAVVGAGSWAIELTFGAALVAAGVGLRARMAA